MAFLFECLDRWAAADPDRPLFDFLRADGTPGERCSYGAFRDRSLALAGFLSRHIGLRRGERVLLAYPPGLEIVAALIACARIGVIGVPVPAGAGVGAERLAAVARDCRPTVGLTTQALSARLQRRAVASGGDGLAALPWVATDTAPAAPPVAETPHDLLLLQYTSGSTGEPRGVMVSHAAVLHNARAVLDHVPIGVSWLPQHHDMGLIGYYLFPLVVGGRTIGMPPAEFLRRPRLWFEAMTQYRATYASAPNFAFAYCLREDRLPTAELDGLALGSLRVLMAAAEPVDPAVLDAFGAKFAATGLRREALTAAYGLAEATLAVTLGGRRSLARGRSQVMSCGRPVADTVLRVIGDDGSALPERAVGEIQVNGPAVSAGYWPPKRATAPGGDRWLPTGDLGWLQDGELFVYGRQKDVIIIRGANHHPQDIEQAVLAACPGLQHGDVVAFAGDTADHTLVVLLAPPPRCHPDLAAIGRRIQALCGGVSGTLALVRPGTILRSSSGKLARAPLRQRWRDGAVPVTRSVPLAPDDDIAGLLARFGLDGQETLRFADIGIDSLSLVLLIEAIEQVLRARGDDALLGRLDARLLQEMTVAEAVALLTAADADGLAASRRAQDARDATAMRADATLAPLPLALAGDSRAGTSPAAGARSAPGIPATPLPMRPQPPAPRRLLMTGATGFFGPFLLARLLCTAELGCCVLVRAADPAHGIARVLGALRAAGLLTPALAAACRDRLQVVPADLAQPRLGLDAGSWDALATQTDAVLHNAARVNYVQTYQALRPHNVEATRWLLQLAADGRRKPFHLISSTIVFGWTAKPMLFEDDCNPAMENLDFGYAQSKWVAEQLCLDAQRQGLAMSIYRPSFLTAAAGGIASGDDIVIRLLAFMIRHGIAVDAANQVSFLPADVAAAAIAGIVGRGGVPGQALHVTVDGYNSLRDVTEAITAGYGYRFVYYPIGEFVTEMRLRCRPEELLYPLVDFFVHAWGKLLAMQAKRYNNSGYRAARGPGLADPPLAETVDRLMQFLLRERLIPPPSADAAQPRSRYAVPIAP